MIVALRAIRSLAAFFLGYVLELGALVIIWGAPALAGQPGWVVFLRGDLPAVAIVGTLAVTLLALILWRESIPLIPVAAFLLGCALVMADGLPALLHALREPGESGLAFAAVSLARGIALPLIAFALLWYKRLRSQPPVSEPRAATPAGGTPSASG